MAATDGLAAFELWMQGRGITYSPALITLRGGISSSCSGAALGVVSTAPIPASAVLCTIPKAQVRLHTVPKDHAHARVCAPCMREKQLVPRAHTSPHIPTSERPWDPCRNAQVLSIRTTALADVLAAEKLRGGLGLLVAVLYEAGIGEASNWWVLGWWARGGGGAQRW